MFIRIKSIKGLKYAYLVKNKWYKRKSRSGQKVQKYLGKVYSLKSNQNISFQDYIQEKIDCYIQNSSHKKIFIDLIRFELKKHNFIEKHNFILTYQSIVVDLNNSKVYDIKTGKRICLELNQGFLSSYTISNLLNFKSSACNDLELGKLLGSAILDAGIFLEEDLFVKIFQKIYKR